MFIYLFIIFSYFFSFFLFLLYYNHVINYLKYNKIISNAASSNKFYLRKEKSNYSLFSINVNNSKKMSKSGNGSLINLKSFSKEYEK